ncbi:hypothetical protein cypCar_00000650 [Cyprinus carpio]|nr:hypothetical protein cypCar_00000650 [Cyprinus carpio]
MVAPQGQALKWIKNMKSKWSHVVSLSGVEGNRPADARFFAENAVQFGSPVLLQNVQEELDPSLAPILNKSLTQVGQFLLYTHKQTHNSTLADNIA